MMNTFRHLSNITLITVAIYVIAYILDYRSETMKVYRIVAIKRFGEIVLLKRWKNFFGESKAYLHILVHNSCGFRKLLKFLSSAQE